MPGGWISAVVQVWAPEPTLSGHGRWVAARRVEPASILTVRHGYVLRDSRIIIVGYDGYICWIYIQHIRECPYISAWFKFPDAWNPRALELCEIAAACWVLRDESDGGWSG
jgi:hypothetical protein